MSYTNEWTVTPKKHIFICKTSGESQEFIRTLLGTWVRKDGKPFSQRVIAQKYYEIHEAPMEYKKLEFRTQRQCIRCEKMRYPSEFYLSSRQINNICRPCISKASHAKRLQAGVKVRKVFND